MDVEVFALDEPELVDPVKGEVFPLDELDPDAEAKGTLNFILPSPFFCAPFGLSLLALFDVRASAAEMSY
jgi:hypothetical protein